MSHRAGWPAATWCFVIGGSLLVVSFGFLAVILSKKGKRRKMTSGELAQSILKDDITDMPTYSVAGPGVGVKVEASATTETLREAAARGDWWLFWSWPIHVVGWTTGTQLVITAVALAAGGLLWIAPVLSGILFVPVALTWIYRPFAVLYGKRDDEEKIPSNETPEEMQRRW